MASTYSTNLALELIGTGDQAGTWGLTTNTNLGTLIEQAISGYVTQAVSTGADTTITIPNGATGVARNMYIELTGTGGASTNLIVPANKKLYFIFNNTASGQVTVKVSGQTGVSVPNKAKMILVSNGTDIVDATNYIGNISAASANITTLTSASATITNLIATSGAISTLVSSDFSATVARSASATITNLLATSATVSSGSTLNGGVVINEPGADVDFRVESNTDANCLFVDASANAVGIGTSSPGAKLDVSGTSFVRFLNSTAPTLDNDTHAGEALFIRSGGTAGSGNVQAVLAFGKADGSSLRSGAAIASVQTTADADQVGLSFYTSTSTSSAQTMAEALRITAAGNVGIGVTPSAWGSGLRTIDIGSGTALTNANSISDTWLSVNAYNNGTNWIYKNSGALATYYKQNNGVHSWHTAPSGTAGDAITFTQAMTLNASGNLGIGTASPIYRIDALLGAGSGNIVRFGQSGVSNGYVITTSGSALTHDWANGGSVAMTLNSSGNLGLGVTPSAWDSSYKALSVNGFALGSQNASGGGELSKNSYVASGGADTYVANGFATKYEQVTGIHRWSIAPSGTAGNAITFTQAMTLNASGELLLGTTSAFNTNAGRANVSINGSSTAMYNLGVANASAGYLYHSGTDMWLNNVKNGILSFYTNNAERARITAAGGFAVGTTTDPGVGNIGLAAGKYLGYSSTAYMTPEDNSIGARVSTPGAFTVWTGATPAERARITSDGNLGVGTTSPTVALDVYRAAYPEIRTRSASYTNTFGIDTVGGFGVLGSVTNNAFVFTTNNTERARIQSGGTFLVSADGVGSVSFASFNKTGVSDSVTTDLFTVTASNNSVTGLLEINYAISDPGIETYVGRKVYRLFWNGISALLNAITTEAYGGVEPTFSLSATGATATIKVNFNSGAATYDITVAVSFTPVSTTSSVIAINEA